MLAGAGYSMAAVQEWLIEHCGSTPADLRRAGKGELSKISQADEGRRAGEISPLMSSPRQLPIVVAGARNAAISMVVRIFGEWSGAAVPVEAAAAAPAAAGAR
jgi:hypothetical protein